MIHTLCGRRRRAWISMLSSAFIVSLVVTYDISGDELNLPVAEGSFQPTPESLEKYQYPDWFLNCFIDCETYRGLR